MIESAAMKLQSSITVHVRDSSQAEQSGNSKTVTIFGQENGFELINLHQIEVYYSIDVTNGGVRITLG